MEYLDINIDLKYSLWEDNKDEWSAYGLEKTYDQIKAAFEGTGSPVKVSTAPRKEIRYGSVRISKGEAIVEFVSLWDEPYCHIPEDFPQDKKSQEMAEQMIVDWFTEKYGFLDWDYDSPIGASVQDIVNADNFEDLMTIINNLESNLLMMESEHSEQFNVFLKGLSV